MTAAAISMAQAARHIGVNRNHLKKLTDEGKIPYWFKTDSGRYYYSLRTIEAHQELAAQRDAGYAPVSHILAWCGMGLTAWLGLIVSVLVVL